MQTLNGDQKMTKITFNQLSERDQKWAIEMMCDALGLDMEFVGELDFNPDEKFNFYENSGEIKLVLKNDILFAPDCLGIHKM